MLRFALAFLILTSMAEARPFDPNNSLDVQAMSDMTSFAASDLNCPADCPRMETPGVNFFVMGDDWNLINDPQHEQREMDFWLPWPAWTQDAAYVKECCPGIVIWRPFITLHHSTWVGTGPGADGYGQYRWIYYCDPAYTQCFGWAPVSYRPLLTPTK